MKNILIATLLVFGASMASAQNYITKEGRIELYSETPILVIDGISQTAGSILNSSTGDVVVSVLITSFSFKEALLQEHFNENYMESDKYPKSQFKGKITNWGSVDLSKDGSYPVTIEGNLIMHGETNPVKSQGTLVVKNGKVSATTQFIVSLEAYKIRVEESYKDRIPDKIKITVNFNYTKIAK